MESNNLTGLAVKCGDLLPANIEVKLSEDNLAQDLLNTTAPVCWSCKNLCRKAFITDHPCTLCSECRDKCLEKLQGHVKIECPCTATCENLQLSESDLQNVNHLYRKKFDSIKFFCPNKNSGCLLQFTFDKMEKHIKDDCKFELKSCKFCEEKMSKNLLDEHEKKECEQRIVQCELCNQDVLYSTHKDIKNEDCCKNFFDTCPYCQDVNVTRDEFVKHLETCKANPIFCSFKEAGCNFFNTDILVKEHEETNQLHHQMCMMTKLNQIAIENERLTKEHKEKEEAKKKEMLNMNQELSEKIETLIIENAKRENERIEKLDTMKKEYDNSLQKLRKENEELSSKIEDLRIHVGLSKTFLNTTIEGNLSVVLSENNQRLWILDGINDKRKHKEMKYSPILHTEPLGYKFRLELYLNGNGAGEGKQVSLFLQIAKGENDDKLKWPCPLKFTLEVLKLTSFDDKSPANVDISCVTTASGHKYCFDKPTGEVNTGLGTPEILAQEEAFSDSGDYVKNDKMVFRVSYE